jgi:uroporphyrinogen decarboxylase
MNSQSHTPLRDHPLMKACRCEAAPFTPIWLMRQAGRYMPEYRAVRERHGFMEMCRRPEVAAEVTVTAVHRLGVDAAIIFADILLPLVPMGAELSYEKHSGPKIAHPLRSAEAVARLSADGVVESLSFLAESIRLARAALPDRPIVGFAGAPFTLASYLIEGGSARDFRRTKSFMYSQPAAWDLLMSMLSKVTIDYLRMQIQAGADLIQLFDSWVGTLSPFDYRTRVLPYTRRIFDALTGETPTIHFGTGTAGILELMREAGGSVIGLDWRVDLGTAWRRLGDKVAVQGNLDPIVLFAPLNELRGQIRSILDAAAGRPGHIFNLGHGILPETPVDSVIALVDMVHEMSAR